MGSASILLPEGPWSVRSRSSNDGTQLSITPATRSTTAVTFRIGSFQSNGSTSCRKQLHVLGRQPLRLSGEAGGGLKKLVLLDRRSPGTDTSSAIFARCAIKDEGVPLNRDEVVELLLVAVKTVLKQENQERLRKRLGKSRQCTNQNPSEFPLRTSNVVRWTASFTPTGTVGDLERINHSEMVEGADAIDFERHMSTQSSPEDASSSKEKKVILVPNTSSMIELVQTSQSKSIESVNSVTGIVESGTDSSLTSIRRLKVLNVHSYVHNALRESALRSWLHSRKIEE